MRYIYYESYSCYQRYIYYQKIFVARDTFLVTDTFVSRDNYFQRHILNNTFIFSRYIYFQHHSFIIYLFLCLGCLSCFHKSCYNIDRCPKCARLEARRLQLLKQQKSYDDD